MLYIEPDSTDAAYHFAVEEYCMRTFPPGERVWMLWQTGRCVMLGCNQVADAEVDLDSAGKLGVNIVRRSSGGGTIYTDGGTLQFTQIAPFQLGSGSSARERESLSKPMLNALRKIGANAALDGRNDITLYGAKISGMAQYYSGGRACSHGSLLYSANADVLAEVLRPDEEKIKAKALRSVRARVTNVIDHLDHNLPLREFWSILKDIIKTEYGVEEYKLTPVDVAEIERIRAGKFASDDWTYGKSPKFSYNNAKRFPLGKVDISLEIAGGVITNCGICGDFMALLPIAQLEARLTGLPYVRGKVEAAVSDIDFQPYLGGISREEFVSVMFR
jgi:lipoate-protein ligase A